MIDIGSGPPLVLVPGIQGRWEWMEPTVRALAAHFRVMTSSLPGEPHSEAAGNGSAPPEGFAAYARQIETMLDRAGVARVTLVGVSFGGLVAAYTAAHVPDRVSALVLVSAPGPSWKADRRTARYMRAPLLMAPMFVAGAPWRLGPEVLAAYDTVGRRLRFAAAQTGRIVRAPMRPRLAGARLRLMASAQAGDWCGRISAPTLVMTGEPRLDRIVPVEGTREYATAIAGARLEELPRTGHIGSVTRADAFAEIVWRFVAGLPTREITGDHLSG